MKNTQTPGNFAQVLKIRAACFRSIRDYFADHGVMEVDTPLLAACSVTDPYMSAMQVQNSCGKALGFLQTSPEYAMKKLLCYGSGDIYQLGKVFRADETSPNHSTEFTMLEWYRTGFDEQQLMDEVYALIKLISGNRLRIDISYRDAFLENLGIDPFDISLDSLACFARETLGELPEGLLFDNYLTLLFAEKIETQFDQMAVTFVYDFPASQASLSRTEVTSYGNVAKRFEAYAGGLELANGFYELTDPELQLERFEEDNEIRLQLGLKPQEIDFQLIESLKKGLPDCSGVALGVDRLIMLSVDANEIDAILPMSLVP